jgi:hypothetical protein
VAAGVLVVVASLLLPIGLVTVWLREQVLDTDAFVRTAGQVARDPALQRDVADKVSDALIEQLDVDSTVQGAARSVLPDALQGLAAPLAAGTDATIRRASAEVVASSRFEDLWEVAVRRAHENALLVAEGDPVAGVETQDGRIAVNLDPMVDAVVAQLPGPIAALIPPVTTGDDIVFFRSSELASAQPVVRGVEDGWWAIPVVCLALFATAIAIAARRRRALLAVGVGLVLSSGLTFLMLLVARQRLVGAAASRVARTATAAVFDAAVDLLRTEMWLTAALGVALVAGAITFGLLRRPHPVAATTELRPAGDPLLPGAEPTVASLAAMPTPDRSSAGASAEPAKVARPSGSSSGS